MALRRQALGAVLLVLAACGREEPNPVSPPPAKPAAPPERALQRTPPPAEPRIEARARLTGIIDGDTIDVEILEASEDKRDEATCAICRQVQLEERGHLMRGTTHVRFAGGIDAPDFRMDQQAAEDAKQFVIRTLEGVEEVVLDLDDGARGCPRHQHRYRDAYCRLLAVIYYRREGQWHNLNEEVLRWGARQYPNFDWLRYRGLPSEFRFEVAGGAMRGRRAVAWSEARAHVGEVVTVEGPVVSTKYADTQRGEPTYLDLGREYPDPERVTVVIWGRNRERFPQPPEQAFRGKRIRVTGEVSLYRDVPQIEVAGPAQIEVVE
jgi:endonuclease YncB( thermonuclease family)